MEENTAKFINMVMDRLHVVEAGCDAQRKQLRVVTKCL